MSSVTTRRSSSTQSASSPSVGFAPRRPAAAAARRRLVSTSTTRTASSRLVLGCEPAWGRGWRRWRCTLLCPGCVTQTLTDMTTVCVVSLWFEGTTLPQPPTAGTEQTWVLQLPVPGSSCVPLLCMSCSLTLHLLLAEQILSHYVNTTGFVDSQNLKLCGLQTLQSHTMTCWLTGWKKPWINHFLFMLIVTSIVSGVVVLILQTKNLLDSKKKSSVIGC